MKIPKIVKNPLCDEPTCGDRIKEALPVATAMLNSALATIKNRKGGEKVEPKHG